VKFSTQFQAFDKSEDIKAYRGKNYCCKIRLYLSCDLFDNGFNRSML